jgi:hypothetical protein
MRGERRSFGAEFLARLVVALVALSLAWLVRPAGAQSCKDLPPGPAKKQCVMQNHPEAFEQKKDKCKALAEQRGSFDGKGTGQKSFVQNCMQGKVSR